MRIKQRREQGENECMRYRPEKQERNTDEDGEQKQRSDRRNVADEESQWE